MSTMMTDKNFFECVVLGNTGWSPSQRIAVINGLRKQLRKEGNNPELWCDEGLGYDVYGKDFRKILKRLSESMTFNEPKPIERLPNSNNHDLIIKKVNLGLWQILDACMNEGSNREVRPKVIRKVVRKGLFGTKMQHKIYKLFLTPFFHWEKDLIKKEDYNTNYSESFKDFDTLFTVDEFGVSVPHINVEFDLLPDADKSTYEQIDKELSFLDNYYDCHFVCEEQRQIFWIYHCIREYARIIVLIGKD